MDATVEHGALPGLSRVHHRIQDTPLVSIVIPTMGGEPQQSPSAAALMACLRSIVERSTYCLRLAREGLRVVYTPYAELSHRESASFGPRIWSAADHERMRSKWADILANDPFYNPNLTRDSPDYRIRL